MQHFPRGALAIFFTTFIHWYRLLTMLRSYNTLFYRFLLYAYRYHIESFETLVGRKFLSFAKSSMFNDDLYSGLVAEVLQSDLLVESWTNGPGTLDSECSRNFQ